MDSTKILLVDDDDAVVSYLVAKLGKLYQVVSTTDPAKAVPMARMELPDLVLCDIDMPVMSGVEVAAAMMEDPMTERIPVLYLTGLVSPEKTRELDGQLAGRPGVPKQAPLSDLVAAIQLATAHRE